MEFSFIGPRMKGINSTFQEWAITPLSSNQYWQPNDVIKIMGNISEGLVDFYRSHIQFELEVTTQMMPVGLIQIDNSAQSVISQTVLLSNQTQIERIQQYDVLAAALTDIGFSQFVCESRQGQGIGFTNIPTNLPATSTSVKPGQFQNELQQNVQNGSMTSYSSGGSFSPVIAPQFSGTGYIGWTAFGSGTDNANNNYILNSNAVQSGVQGGSYQNLANWITYPLFGDVANNYVAGAGRAMGVRSQYNLAPQMSGYPDSPSSFPTNAPYIANQQWTYSNMTTNGFNPNNPYQIKYNQTPPSIPGTGYNPFVPITLAPCGISGYTKPIGSQFCRGCNQPVISPTLPQVQMAQGVILPSPIPVQRKTFRMPLISAVCGVLVPPDQFQLIPAQSLKNILLQITLNPYAAFTSGYSDIHQLDSTGMQPGNMQKRKWVFNSFQWVWHLYTFNAPQIMSDIKDKLYKGITISSNYWQLSAQYQLPNGSYVRNSFQIPTNVQSLAEVMIIFLSNEYQTKSFCRKQFRLSNNITSLQFKANGSYYPLQPIQGNAGNPESLDTTGDNWNYYELLLLSNNFLFNTNVPLPKINQKNFAINGRIYNTSNMNTLLPSTLYQLAPVSTGALATSLSSFATATVNADTAMGQSWFHQNRYVGKAIFSYSFEPYGHSKGMIHGLDTRGYRQFDVILNNSPTQVFPSDQTMLIFTRSNVVVRYTMEGIQVHGA